MCHTHSPQVQFIVYLPRDLLSQTIVDNDIHAPVARQGLGGFSSSGVITLAMPPCSRFIYICSVLNRWIITVWPLSGLKLHDNACRRDLRVHLSILRVRPVRTAEHHNSFVIPLASSNALDY